MSDSTRVESGRRVEAVAEALPLALTRLPRSPPIRDRKCSVSNRRQDTYSMPQFGVLAANLIPGMSMGETSVPSWSRRSMGSGQRE
jgi:hypothetical protein